MGGLIEWYRKDYLGDQAEKWDERAESLPQPIGAPAQGAALLLDTVDSPDTPSEISDHMSDVESDLRNPGLDGGHDLPDPPDVPEWGGWILENLDKVVLALIVLYLISTLGPGLAETAQAAGGDS
ncbi:hypothetical protein [Halapricum hydrolyticum]|uniref:Uncharacterized protein n=1 Tax=Halapricum hydrolyticum TaxID=2979991 RepID=A0AAE3LDS2_9EURY|nr:hypothetical protein [Halapricum hydrolyticum]MCU4716859.1 hypothetical protein [Halapricum hydrolyticum]MCU4725536.1 hypothetical protein [Halapricum hydrolyticum]